MLGSIQLDVARGLQGAGVLRGEPAAPVPGLRGRQHHWPAELPAGWILL